MRAAALLADRRLVSAAPAALLALAVCVHAAAVPLRFVDDAYIAFRYAANFHHGHGLTYNPAESVEGFSSLIWVLAASALLGLGAPLEPAIRWLSVALLVATVLLVRRLVLRSGAGPAVATAVALLAACSSAWIVPMLNGLEGPLFSLLLLLATALHWGDAAGGARSLAWASGAVGVALAATRPEGAALWLAQAAAGALVAPGERRRQAMALGVFLAGLGLLLAWRVATYGTLMPNPVLAKLGSPSDAVARVLYARFGSGLRYALELAVEVWPMLLVAVAAAFLVACRPSPGADRRGVRLATLAAVPALAGVAVVLVSGGDWMPHHRLLAPYLPLAVVAAGALLSPAPRGAVAGLALASALSLSPAALERPALAALREHQPDDFHRLWSRFGADLQAAAAPGSTLVAAEVIGVLGYSAQGLRVRDLNGLADRSIALHEPSSGVYGRKTRPATLEALAPDVLVINDLSYWRRLQRESAWFSREWLALACDELLSAPLYAFVRRGDLALQAPRFPVCAGDRLPPAEAFRKASALRRDWPYAFSRAALR